MFQTFQSNASPDQGPPRLADLRKWMAGEGLDGFIIPRADKHQGEYVAPCDERLAWLTGFTGSAGFAVALADRAGVFIDGRYRVQVKAQVADVFTPVHWPEVSLGQWLKDNASADAVIGFDPWLHTVEQVDAAQKVLNGTGITLKPCPNGIDAIWSDRPMPPKNPAWAHDMALAGQSSGEKCAAIGKALADAGQTAAVLTMPESICWLLNIRGSDVPCTPLAQAFAIIGADGRVALFADQSKFAALGPDPKIDQLDWTEFPSFLAGLSGKVLVDPASLPFAAMVSLKAGDATLVKGSDPCALPRACKNAVELQGARDAHLKDAIAYAEFLCWFETQSNLTEIDVVKRLETFRRDIGDIHDISFETISGSGPNGAIVHYRVTEETNRPLDQNSVLLLDSGAQYPSGTTDITRVLPLGTPSADIRKFYTHVLQGMIAVSRLRFPKGVAGKHIDSFARAPLWEIGCDFDHGTGHGVGSFLSVHEGPQRISRLGNVAFQPGMIVSNEPGYYREGAFGIRIENLLAVQNAPDLDGADAREMLSFETLTLVPIDTRLVDPSLMTAAEVDWLNTYHAHVLETVGPHVTPDTLEYLKTATQKI